MKRETGASLRGVAIAGLMVATMLILWPPPEKGQEHGQPDGWPAMGFDGNRAAWPESRRSRTADPADGSGRERLDGGVGPVAPAPLPRLPVQAVHLRGCGDAGMGGAHSRVFEVTGRRRLFNAIRQVESGGDDKAVGDGGLAHGPMQIHFACWLDGGGKASDYPAQAHDWEASKRIALNYWTRYRATTNEERARCWNSGPKWRAKYHLTDKYWQKVKKALALQ